MQGALPGQETDVTRIRMAAPASAPAQRSNRHGGTCELAVLNRRQRLGRRHRVSAPSDVLSLRPLMAVARCCLGLDRAQLHWQSTCTDDSTSVRCMLSVIVTMPW